MPNMEHNNPKRKKKPVQHTQTVIIPQITPEILEQARRAAETPPTPPQPAPEQPRQEQRTEQPRPAAQQTHAKPAKRTRAEAEAELYQSIHDDHLWLNNPVMVRGLGLAPVVAVASDGDNALMLCAAAILLLTTTRMLAVAVCHLTGNRFRALVYSFSAAVLYIPAYLILYHLFGADLSVLGIYLPLLVVEPAIIKRLEAPELESVGEAFRRGINNTVGLCISLLLVGSLREVLSVGTLFGHTILNTQLLPLASQPAGGFLLLGFISAIWTAVGGAYVHYKREEVRHLYGNRKH